MSNTTPRLVIPDLAPKAYSAMIQLEQAVRGLGLEPSLYELVKIRASQINGCAFCIDMHTKDARAHGETEQRIYALDAWRETPFFSSRERAALALTEAVTLITKGHVSDAASAKTESDTCPIVINVPGSVRARAARKRLE